MHRYFRPFTMLVNINHSLRYGYRLLVPLVPCPPPLFSNERDRRLHHYVKHVLSSHHSCADSVLPPCLSMR